MSIGFLKTRFSPQSLASIRREMRALRLASVHAVGGIMLLSAASAAAAAEPLRASGQPSADPEVKAFIDEMGRRHRIPRSELESLFASAAFTQRVLDAFSRPAESKPWYQYRPIFVTEKRARAGVAYWQEHRALLERIEGRFGVPPEVVVAIVGVETNYGTSKGRIRTLDALTTLAFRYPRRSAFFRRELESFILLSREEGVDARAAAGSYAGALGIPQFIPSSYRAYAIDFDGDGRRDLLASTSDALGSVANYLSRHRWEGGGPIASRVSSISDRGAISVSSDLKPSTRVSELTDRGIALEAQVPGETRAALISLQTSSGVEYWAGFQNFYAITRYNPSKLYGMAVYQLADEIRTRYQNAAASGS